MISRPRYMPADQPAASPDAVETLIQRCLQGDQHAWDLIVRQYWRKVFNVAYKFVGKHDEAEDLTQDIFLKIFRSLDTFDRRANFQTWLISVSRNLCIDHYRSVRKERETIDRGVDASELSPAHRSRGQSPRSSSAIASSCCGRRWRHCPRRCGRRCCCGIFRSCRIRKSPTSCACRKGRSSRGSTAAAPSSPGQIRKLRGSDAV
jgi:RNA polymerase sigma factor (sigma-70 family)